MKISLGTSLASEMASQSVNRRIQGFIMLAEAKTGEVPRRPVRAVVEGADRHGGHPRLDRDMAAEILVAAVETQWPEVGGDEIGAVGRQHLEADLGQRASQPVALALHVAGQ